jgi:hypothetical protein
MFSATSAVFKKSLGIHFTGVLTVFPKQDKSYFDHFVHKIGQIVLFRP